MITSVDEFLSLLDSDEPVLRRRTLTEEAPEEVWFAIIELHPEARKWVAANKTVPLSVLRVLADDTSSEVRWEVAQRRRLDRDLFERLFRDPDESVRQRIACNAKTPDDVLRRLVDDSWEGVSEVARERLRKDTT
jgi:hypothetical protein